MLLKPLTVKKGKKTELHHSIITIDYHDFTLWFVTLIYQIWLFFPLSLLELFNPFQIILPLSSILYSPQALQLWLNGSCPLTTQTKLMFPSDTWELLPPSLLYITTEKAVCSMVDAPIQVCCLQLCSTSGQMSTLKQRTTTYITLQHITIPTCLFTPDL